MFTGWDRQHDIDQCMEIQYRAEVNLMQVEPVVSSNIAGIGFDKDNGTLRVEFMNGSAFEFAGVPESVHEQFMQSDSKGKFFFQNIKGQYQHVKAG
jgi:hypothetical protein